MKSMMKVAVMKGIGKIEFEEQPIPTPGVGEILVRIKNVGVCGSDIHYFIDGKIGNFVVTPPFVLGHECAGEVVELGKNVKKIKVGDRVALEPGIPCGRCEFCLSGRYNLCSNIAFWATPPVDGVFREYVVHPEFLAYPLTEGTSFSEGALIEPLAVGVHAIQRANIRAGMSAVILGSGAIGLVTLQALLAHGVTEVFVVDVVDFRLERAKAMGATEVINAKQEDVKERICEFTKGEGVDVSFETAGTQVTIQEAVEVTKPGGKVIFIGLAPKELNSVNTMKIVSEQLDVLGVWRYANVYKASTELVNTHKVNLELLISHYFEFKDVERAFLFAHEHKDESLKIVIKI